MKKISSKGLDYIKKIEQFAAKVYKDQGGFPTIGYGHLITKAESSSGKIKIGDDFVKYSFGLSINQATVLLDQDCDEAERAVNEYVKVDLAQHQFDALVSFTFNVGVSALRGSTLLKVLNAGKINEVPNQLLRWVFTNGKRSNGLERRRKEEGRIWVGDYLNG